MERETLALVIEGLDRIFADAPLESIDRSLGQCSDSAALWAILSENGYARLCSKEEHGGFGGSYGDLISLAGVVAKHAASVPLIDTALAMALLSEAGVEAPDLRIGIMDPVDPHAHLAHAVQIDAALFLREGNLCLTEVSPADFAATYGSEDGAGSLIREPQKILVEIAAPSWLSPLVVRGLGALTRSALMAASMQAVLDMTLSYTRDREQFGRSLAKFQAIQHHLSDIACETAASQAAVQMAADALCADRLCGEQTIEEFAIAKVRCSYAASRVAAGAHQAHGAMGFTWEYMLGRYTRRLWQWQDEFGSEQEWATQIGHSVLGSANPALWPRISRPI